MLPQTHPGHSTELGIASALVTLLTKLGCAKRSALLFVELRGLGFGQPRSLRSVSAKLSGERVRQLVGELEAGALQALRTDRGPESAMLRVALEDALRKIEAVAPGSNEDIQQSLELQDTTPAGVIRIADILGVHHGLRLTSWVDRAKFADQDRTLLATPRMPARKESVCGVVPDSMPEVFQQFLNFARKFSRGAGVLAAGQLAERFGLARGIALAPYEAVALLRPFAVHLGRHDGDEWFTFANSTNDFIRKVTARIEVLGLGSFVQIRLFHQRFNRSVYVSNETAFPDSVLRSALELAGYRVEGDRVSAMKSGLPSSGRGISEIQVKMVQVFRDTIARTPDKTTVRRADLIRAMQGAGINESTARVYLGSQGLFVSYRGLCRLADSANPDEPADQRIEAGASAPA